MRCDTSCEGKSALQRLQDAASQEQAYDVAIIDAGLPAMDGLTLVRRIRSERQIADLPVILLTPIAYPLEVGQISRIGGIRCVNKPVLPGELKHNLCKLIANDQSSVVVDSSNDYGADTSAETGELRILIAEDNALSRQLLKNMLISVGCEADTANDGPSVLEALADDAYDLVLMDCQMPGMDGDEVTRHVRSEPGKYRAQPVIVAVTADVSPNHRAACREAGMDDFLAKPVRRRQLVEGLQRWSADVSRTRREASDAGESLTPEQQIHAQLLNRGEDDKDFLRVYIDAFLDDTSSRLKLIDAAAEREDWHAARRECHALRGACLEMGAAAMEKHCVTVGNAAENGNASQARDAVRDLEKEFDHIRPVFKAAKKHFSA